MGYWRRRGCSCLIYFSRFHRGQRFNASETEIFQKNFIVRKERLARLVKGGMILTMAAPKDDSYPTRSSLLMRLKDTQDQRSWQEFNDRYGRLIFGFALKAGLTETEAEEVVQETMISASKHLPEFRYNPRVCAFKTWLLNLSRWRVQDQFRKRIPTKPVGIGSQAETDRTTTIERVADPAGHQLDTIWDQEWQTTLLNTALTKIKPQVKPKEWQMFDLYALKGWSPGDVADALGVSVGRVYLVKHRVSARLKKEMKRLEQAQ
jgi:RNA polymerase sigma-70 factor (ECF subfamily)